MRPALLIAAALATVVFGAPAYGQDSGEELILDPENPAVAEPESPSGEETIVDPENQPSGEEIISDPENSADETIVDPENTGSETINDPENLVPPNEPDTFASFQNATFVGRYATLATVDVAFEGGNEDIFENLTALDLRLELDASDNLSVVLEGEFRHWWSFEEGASNGTAAYDARLGDAYLVWRTGPWSVAAGNLVTT